jgi:hypothetical protein
MIIKNRIRIVLTLAAVAMAILGPMTTIANAAVTELVSALTALKDHIEGTTPLTATEIAAHKATIDLNSQYMGDNATVIAASFDMVAAYDNTPGYGPLWINQGNFTRDSAPDDIHWTTYWVMQYIMDDTYTTANISSHEVLLDGFKFECSAHFPGAVDPPANPEVTYTATIDGTYLDMWGHDVMHEERPARKPTGTYLAPGSIVTVTVPSSIVGKGYQVRVGAHSWDNSNRPKCRRLDRSSLVYSIDSTVVKVASPLGGGIYIEVPEHEDAGIVNVQIKNAVRSPFFSARSFHSTTIFEWQNIERNHPGPWADFQSEKFMMQVPTDWIYNFDNPVTLMQDWDTAMDALNDLMGYPTRSRESMYPQVDLQFRSSVYAPGYPSVNVTYNPNTNYGGNYNHYLLKGPQFAAHQAFHEEGHGYLFVKFSGETESNVNLHHVAVWNQKFGYDLDYAFAASCGYHGNPHRTLDNTAITWMTVFNFSPRQEPMASGEKAYQLKGHAKFVDIAKLFGWEGLGAFWYSINVDFEDGIIWSRHGSDIDDLILRWCESVGVDLRPLFHFWGIHPGDPVALEAAIEDQNLPASAEIYDRLVHYKSLVPADNAAFHDFALNWWGHQPSINGYWTEREHTRQWDNTSYWQDNGWEYMGTDPGQADGEIYTEATCARIKAVIDGLLDLYFPYGRPTYSIFGDCNKDGRVDFKDIACLALYWSQTSCGQCGGADFTDDEQVDIRDVDAVAEYWLTAGTIPPLPEHASNPNPTDNALGVATTAILSWTAGSGATSHDVYIGTSNPPPFICNQTTTTFVPGWIPYHTTVYWRIDEINGWGRTTGEVWEFTTVMSPPPIPGQASNPNPVNDATGVSIDQDLSWTPGSGAISHDVYFGTSMILPFIKNQMAATFDPGRMEIGTKYYWRINEKTTSGTVVGPLWSFIASAIPPPP